jgi:hypothetical protein
VVGDVPLGTMVTQKHTRFEVDAAVWVNALLDCEPENPLDMFPPRYREKRLFSPSD